MTAAPDVAPSVLFAELLEELRRQGFAIGVDHHLRLQLLLDRMAGDISPDRLASHLAPIFATSPEEQARFRAVFDRLYPAFSGGDAAPVGGRGTGPVHATPQPGRRVRRAILGGVLLLLLATALGVWLARPAPGPTPTPTPASPSAPTAPPAGRPSGDSVVPSAAPPVPSAEALPAAAPVPLPAAPAPEASFATRHRGLLQVLAILLPLLIFSLNEWRLYQRRQLVVERQRREKPPFTWPIRIATPVNPFAGTAELPTVARRLRQREEGETRRLWVEGSVQATIGALGLPTFRYRSDTRPPDYLILIERESHRDHGAQLIQALVDALAREGVHATQYFYDEDPRVCIPVDGRPRQLLIDLQRRHPGHRLLVFGAGTRLVDPISSRLVPWADLFQAWGSRALLTPESPAAWGPRESALAQQFLVLPASLQALQAAVEHFEGRGARGRLTGGDEPGPAPRLDGDDVLPALRSYLGAPLFRWLCFSALYPELHWALTLQLGTLPQLGPGLFTEAALLRLLRLPWYRQGAIPDAVRMRLIEQLSDDEERAARATIVDVLEQHPAPRDSVSANRYEFDMAVQRLALGRRDPVLRARALQEIRNLPPRQLVQDFAMVRLLEEVPSSRLAMILPRRLRRVFYQGGLPVLGPRMAVRGLLAAGIGLTAFLAAGGLSEQPASDDLQSNLMFNSGGILRAGDTLYLLPGETRGVNLIPRVITAVDMRPSLGELVQASPEDYGVVATRSAPERPGGASLQVIARESGSTTVRVRTSTGLHGTLPVRVEPGRIVLKQPEADAIADTIRITVGESTLVVPRVPSQKNRQVWLDLGPARILDTNIAGLSGKFIVGRRIGTTPLNTNLFGQEIHAEIIVHGTEAGIPLSGEARNVAQVIQDYARALQSGDLNGMLSAYPGLPAEERQRYQQVFANRWVYVTDGWRIEDVKVSGTSAEAGLGGTSELRDSKGKVSSRASVALSVRLRRIGGRWQITAITPRVAGSNKTLALSAISRGMIYLDQADTATALRWFLQADSLDPGNPSILQRLTAIRASGWNPAARNAGRIADMRRQRLRADWLAYLDSALARPAAAGLSRNLRLSTRRDSTASVSETYNQLKAYLLLTGAQTSAVAVPALVRAWSAEVGATPDVAEVAREQFSLYVDELAQHNLRPQPFDSVAVASARGYLRSVPTDRLVYALVIADVANEVGQNFDFNRRFPNQALTTSGVVAPEFTRAGWVAMQRGYEELNRYFVGLERILAHPAWSNADRDEIVRRLKVRYRSDYAAAWRGVLASARIAPMRDLRDASRKLKILAGNTSPLIQLINAVSFNTAVDSILSVTTFQPAMVVSPPDSMKPIGEAIRPYLKALGALSASLDQVVATASSGQNQAVQEARQLLAEARTAAAAIQVTFALNGVGPDISRLLSAPFPPIEVQLGRLGAAGVNSSGQAFCSDLGQVLTKAPMNPNGPPASLDELTAFFGRPDGALWQLYNSSLSTMITYTGRNFVATPGTRSRVNPPFLEFFNRAAQFSRMLYPDGQTEVPRLGFSFRGITSRDVTMVRLTVDSVTESYTPNRNADMAFTWIGAQAESASLSVVIRGASQEQPHQGTFGLFSLFATARNWKSLGVNRYSGEWSFTVAGQSYPVPFEIAFNDGAAPILQGAWLRGLECVPTIEVR